VHSTHIQHVCVAQSSVDSSNPFLYHKTTNRLVYDQALAASPGYDDVILWNEKGKVTESCIANIVGYYIVIHQAVIPFVSMVKGLMNS
jgi:branched-subunit amino acid aminotransferase/4-amino-4-deoxychorismate lyase